MSGGHYQYQYYHLNNLADDIERSFLNNGVINEFDYLNDANPLQKQHIIQEVQDLIKDLRNVAARAKELEWFMSGDTGPKTYIERLNKISNL